MIESPGSQKFNPPPDPDGIFPSSSHGNASYFDGISTDPPDAPALRHDKHKTVHRLYCRNSTDLCSGIRSDLHHDCKILLSYRGTKIEFNKLNKAPHLQNFICK